MRSHPSHRRRTQYDFWGLNVRLDNYVVVFLKIEVIQIFSS